MTGPQFGKPNPPVPGFGFANLADKAENGFRNGGRINSEVGLGYISGCWLLFCKKKLLQFFWKKMKRSKGTVNRQICILICW